MRLFVISFFVILVLVAGFLTGIIWNPNLIISPKAALFIIIVLAGSFGGMLYTARDYGLELPRRNPEKNYAYQLGWVADCGYGIGGALVVFLILPTEIIGKADGMESILKSASILPLIKLLALAIVGGYGGRSFVDQATANLAKKVKDASEKADKAEKKAGEAEEKLIATMKKDAKARELVYLHLDDSKPAQDPEKIITAIKEASLAARVEIFREARNVRTDNWENNKDLMARTIPVFMGLIENEAKETYHRNHAQLAYALKDKSNASLEDWKKAYNELSKAIELRDAEELAGFQMYEMNRAICGIKLGKDKTTILKDLKACDAIPAVKEKLKAIDLITNWAETNHFDLDTLELKA